MMDGKNLYAALFIALLAGAYFAAEASPTDFGIYKAEEGQKFETRLNDWIPLAEVAIMICILFVALVYVLGYALQSEHLKKYAQEEFLQVTASTLMIFFAVALLYGLTTGSGFDLMGEVLGTGSVIDCAAAPNGVFNIWQGGTFGKGPIAAFKCKVQEKITALDNQYNRIFDSNRGTEWLTSTCFVLFGAPVFCGDWDFALHKEVETNHLLGTKIVSLLVPLHAQFVLAEYIQKNMLTVFLPLGLVLRIFSFTRGVGGLFIAMAIGFYFVWPTFFLLTDPTFVRVDAPEGNDNIAGACYTGFKGTATVMQSIFVQNAGSMNSNQLETENATELLFQITIATLFYPFVAFVIALVFIRALTPLLGGDMGELMKMVARLG